LGENGLRRRKNQENEDIPIKVTGTWLGKVGMSLGRALKREEVDVRVRTRRYLGKGPTGRGTSRGSLRRRTSPIFGFWGNNIEITAITETGARGLR